MTPTLYGRWQTRFILLITVGVLITLFFGWLFQDYVTTLSILAYVLVIGFGWDILYQFLQTFRWDEDWPVVFQVFTGLAEAILIWILIKFVPWEVFGQTQLPGVNPNITFLQFFYHYFTVWLAVLLCTQGPLRIIFPRWRFFGGQWL